MAVRVTLVLLGTVTAGPALALVQPRTLSTYAGLDVPADPMILALLQHRGVLQGALGAALIYAAFHPALRVPAAVTAITTKSIFLVLMATLPGPSRLADITGVPIDIAAIILLALVIAHTMNGRRLPARATVTHVRSRSRKHEQTM
ncbi:hypothetical protein Acsp03_49910 [Actinomadura sp. NBRC 104412]|uniref:hypothetical protein n=1 Tax=Actinomadura sp. NBRC 104412 TaxID=3032203 RepID=UPI0024A13A40|nr:hypothetical protein [Actinomadura sp. NBRC 104412]GLZ07525.1 hypothetical protein Acsp03_49910 [Actinomadura sp. NBRC 104412]